MRQMIANAVPAPVAQALGRVIGERHSGESLPHIEGRFLDWLERGGRSRATARNIKSNVIRARRLLGARTFSNLDIEIATLEATDDFMLLKKATKSDLRQAVRLFAQYLSSTKR